MEEPLQQQLEKKADEELKKLKSEGTRDDTTLDMEFDDSTSQSNIKPPPLQDSKDYYNST